MNRKPGKTEFAKRMLAFLPAVVMMIIIYAFSAMQGDESSRTSGVFLKALMRFAEEITHKGFTDKAVESLHLIIRKCAHFTEYALLGACAVHALKNGLLFYNRHPKLSVLFAEIYCALYAATDEVHQYFVPGRYGTWSDVVIDSLGAIFGILMFAVFVRKRFKKGTKHEI